MYNSTAKGGGSVATEEKGNGKFTGPVTKGGEQDRTGQDRPGIDGPSIRAHKG